MDDQLCPSLHNFKQATHPPPLGSPRGKVKVMTAPPHKETLHFPGPAASGLAPEPGEHGARPGFGAEPRHSRDREVPGETGHGNSQLPAASAGPFPSRTSVFCRSKGSM